MPPPRHPRRHLAEVIASERSRWTDPLSIGEVGQRTGLSRSTVDTVIHGRGEGAYRATTLAAFDRLMGWMPGSCESVMHGGRQVHIEDRERAELNELWPRLNPQGRRAVLQVARAAVRGH